MSAPIRTTPALLCAALLWGLPASAAKPAPMFRVSLIVKPAKEPEARPLRPQERLASCDQFIMQVQMLQRGFLYVVRFFNEKAPELLSGSSEPVAADAVVSVPKPLGSGGAATMWVGPDEHQKFLYVITSRQPLAPEELVRAAEAHEKLTDENNSLKTSSLLAASDSAAVWGSAHCSPTPFLYKGKMGSAATAGGAVAKEGKDGRAVYVVSY